MLQAILTLFMISANAPFPRCVEYLAEVANPRRVNILIYELKDSKALEAIPSEELFPFLRDQIEVLRAESRRETLRSTRQFARDLRVDIFFGSSFEPPRKTVLEAKAWAALFRLDYALTLARIGLSQARIRKIRNEHKAFEILIREIAADDAQIRKQLEVDLSRLPKK